MWRRETIHGTKPTAVMNYPFRSNEFTPLRWLRRPTEWICGSVREICFEYRGRGSSVESMAGRHSAP